MPTKSPAVEQPNTSAAAFMSRHAVAAIREAHTRVIELQKRLTEARRDLNLIKARPVTLKLAGKDPEAEARAAESVVEGLESEFSSAMMSRAALFLDSRKQFGDARSAAINSLRSTSIDPAVAKFQSFIEIAEGTIAEIVNEINSISSSSKASSLDAAIISWNKLCHECAGPNNAMIAPSDAVQVSAANILSNTCRDFVVRITRSVKTLTDSLAATQLKIQKESAVPPIQFVDHETI